MRAIIGLGAFIAGAVSGGWIVWMCWSAFFAADPGDSRHWMIGAQIGDVLKELFLMAFAAGVCGIALCVLALSAQRHGQPVLAIALAGAGYFIALPMLVVKILAVSARM